MLTTLLRLRADVSVLEWKIVSAIKKHTVVASVRFNWGYYRDLRIIIEESEGKPGHHQVVIDELDFEGDFVLIPLENVDDFIVKLIRCVQMYREEIIPTINSVESHGQRTPES